jgi:hypothetical protein
MRLLPLVLVLVASSPALADPTTQLIGRIVEASSHRPIEGATVTIGATQVTTNEHGIYRVALAAGGTFDVTFEYLDQHTTRPVTIATGAAVTLDGMLPVDSAETIVIHDPIPPKVLARPVKHYARIAPPYSDEAIVEDAWAKAWLLLDIDQTGQVTRVKLLHHPGHGLDQIAISQGLTMKFDPALDASGNPVPSRQIWPIEWPSYWWLVDFEGVTTGIPPTIYQVPCRDSGQPMHVMSVHPVYRDCSPPDFSKAASEPWISR